MSMSPCVRYALFDRVSGQCAKGALVRLDAEFRFHHASTAENLSKSVNYTYETMAGEPVRDANGRALVALEDKSVVPIDNLHIRKVVDGRECGDEIGFRAPAAESAITSLEVFDNITGDLVADVAVPECQAEGARSALEQLFEGARIEMRTSNGGK